MARTHADIAGVMLALVSGVRAEPFITRENQASNNGNLIVHVGDLPALRLFPVMTLKDHTLPKGICSAFFVVGTNGSPTNSRAMTPLQLDSLQDGTKGVEVYVGSDLLKDVFLWFDYLEGRLAPPQSLDARQQGD